MKKLLILFVLVAAGILSITSCNKDPKVECDGTVYSYSLNVQPLLNSSCNTAGCHNSGSTLGDFTSYDGVKAKVDNVSLKARILDGSMPVNSTLNLDQKEVIVCWIENGALDN